jgi:hypothetical protein
MSKQKFEDESGTVYRDYISMLFLIWDRIYSLLCLFLSDTCSLEVITAMVTSTKNKNMRLFVNKNRSTCFVSDDEKNLQQHPASWLQSESLFHSNQ